jgi:hypothetical protein
MQVEETQHVVLEALGPASLLVPMSTILVRWEHHMATWQSSSQFVLEVYFQHY